MSERPNDQQGVKTCIRCGETKPLDGFSFDRRTNKYINTCKACKVLIAKQNYLENKEKRQAYAKEYRETHKTELKDYFDNYRAENAEQRRAYSKQYNRDHKDEISVKRKAYRQAHKDEFRERDRQYAETHKEQIAKRYKEWAKANAERLAEYNKQYRTANAEAISEQRKDYAKKNRKKITKYYLNKRATDPLFKVSTQVRGLIRASLLKRGYSKDTNTYDIIGCDYETLWQHLKQSWLDNYGQEWNGEPYHIDHIIPLATAKTEQEVKDLCYYKNLQLLKPRDNLVKNKSLEWQLNRDDEGLKSDKTNYRN